MARQVFFVLDQHAIGVERHDATIRTYTGEPPRAGDSPTADGVVRVMKVGDDPCTLHAAQGSLDIRHMQLIAYWLNEAGFRWAYAKRVHGALPLFRLVKEEGPFKGWFKCDVAEAVERAAQRWPSPPRKVA